MNRSEGTWRAVLLATAVAAAACWPAGRLWIALALLLGAAMAVRGAWRRRNRRPAMALTAAAAVVLACFLVGRDGHNAVEEATRRLYAERVTGTGTRTASVDGPTGQVAVTVTFRDDAIAAVEFTHREPPWVGDAPLAALVAAVVEAKRLVSPRASTLRSPVERAGLRALEIALLPRNVGSVAWSAFAGALRGEQDGVTLATLPSVFLLVLLASAGLVHALGRRGS